MESHTTNHRHHAKNTSPNTVITNHHHHPNNNNNQDNNDDDDHHHHHQDNNHHLHNNYHQHLQTPNNTNTTTNNHHQNHQNQQNHQNHQYHQPHHNHQQQQQQQQASTWSPLPSWARFYLYGLQGVLDEVVFTALFDLLLHPEGNRQLKGYTTLTSFFIYGSCSFAMESCFVYCKRRGYPMFIRVLTYVLSAYIWEFFFGLLLRQFHACSWDYSHYPLNLMGLITLLYAPGWMLLGIGQDFMYRYLFSLHLKREHVEKLR